MYFENVKAMRATCCGRVRRIARALAHAYGCAGFLPFPLDVVEDGRVHCDGGVRAGPLLLQLVLPLGLGQDAPLGDKHQVLAARELEEVRRRL